jgi:GT2 family glycosyltransferase
MKNLVCCVIPNWNGKDSIGACITSLQAQSRPCNIIVVENGSIDGSVEYLEQNFPNVVLLKQPKNLGFAEGVNVGIRYALRQGASSVALINNDAIADKAWLKSLLEALETHSEVGIVTCKLVDSRNTHMDSTGDMYTSWGLPYPRGRGEPVSTIYDKQNFVFGASGGASLYKTDMLRQVGLFDKDFFAYYEDVDISFRAQLAGWKVYFEPSAIAYHQIGATSSKIKGFTTYQTLKNLPWLMWKNVPLSLLPTVLPRFTLAYWAFFVSAIQRGQVWAAIKGVAVSIMFLPKKLLERRRIMQSKKVNTPYIRSILTWDLPPNALKLRLLRTKWNKLNIK